MRYLEVKADGDVAKNSGRDFFLLPIGSAQLDDEHDHVIVQMSTQQLARPGLDPTDRRI